MNELAAKRKWKSGKPAELLLPFLGNLNLKIPSYNRIKFQLRIYNGNQSGRDSRFCRPKCTPVISLPSADGKYHMLSSGELMILNITREDAERTYRCRTHHRLTQETVVSSNVGRLQLTGEYTLKFPLPRNKITHDQSMRAEAILVSFLVFIFKKKKADPSSQISFESALLPETLRNVLKICR